MWLEYSFVSKSKIKLPIKVTMTILAYDAHK